VLNNWFFKKFFKKQFAIARFISTYTNIPVNTFPFYLYCGGILLRGGGIYMVPGGRAGGLAVTLPSARLVLAIRQKTPCRSFWQVVVFLVFPKSIFLTASSFLKKWLKQMALNLALAKNCGKVSPLEFLNRNFCILRLKFVGGSCDEGFFVFS
jgi:hypothetical protein